MTDPDPDRITYRDVPVPEDIWAAWTGPLGDAFRAGVDAARKHPRVPADQTG